ncbi:MAG: biotin carboxylase, partial [Hydrogenophaga sp.]|nr:biotin carboxylase [Hydrogenophaga sp.]
MIEIRSPMQAHVVECAVSAGDAVRTGDVLLIVEAMKMEHELRAPSDGVVIRLDCVAGDVVHEGDLLLCLAEGNAASSPTPAVGVVAAPAGERADLRRLRDRERYLADEARPQAVARRHAMGMRTARENIADLC